MHEAVPEGIAWTGLGVAYNGQQLDIKGDDEQDRRLDHITGYDPDEYMTMELVMAGHDPKDDRTRRSHLGLLVTRRVNKIVSLPVLKDHGSAGRHRGAEEHEPRAGEQRLPVALNPPTPTSATSSSRRSSPIRSSARSASCRSWTASGRFIRAVRARMPESDLGEQCPAVRHRPGGDGSRRSGGLWTRSDGRRDCRRSPPAARKRAIPSRARALTSASRSTSRWPGTSGSGTSTSTRRGAGGTGSSTASWKSPDRPCEAMAIVGRIVRIEARPTRLGLHREPALTRGRLSTRSARPSPRTRGPADRRE